MTSISVTDEWGSSVFVVKSGDLISTATDFGLLVLRAYNWYQHHSKEIQDEILSCRLYDTIYGYEMDALVHYPLLARMHEDAPDISLMNENCRYDFVRTGGLFMKLYKASLS